MSALITQITSGGDNQFYPAPPGLAAKMFEGVDLDGIKTVLEPSAGKGNLIEAFGEAAFTKQTVGDYSLRNESDIEVDAVEIDPFLRSIIEGQFSSKRKREEHDRCEKVTQEKRNDKYSRVFDEDKSPLLRTLEHFTVRVVHDNFLTFRPYKRYDLIVMNPPFKDGDKHLLHALEIQKDGGMVICLLNAETIKNVCTNTRRDLQKLLNKYGAEIEIVYGAFKDAERAADVDVAIIRAFIPAVERTSSIFERLEKAAEQEDFTPQSNELAPFDFIEAGIRRFNLECRAGIELIREWQAMVPYIGSSLDKDDYLYKYPTLSLKVERDKDPDVNGYLGTVKK